MTEQAVEEDSQSCGRNWTVSIALPSSIVDNAQSPELRSYLVGQIARCLVIFNVDEVVVYDEHCIPGYVCAMMIAVIICILILDFFSVEHRSKFYWTNESKLWCRRFEYLNTSNVLSICDDTCFPFKSIFNMQAY